LPGYAGSEHNPFIIQEDPSKADFSIDGVSLPNGLSSSRFSRRERMLQKLDNWQKKIETKGNDVGAMNSFYDKAFSMVTSPAAKRAFDLSQEPVKVRERYGMNKFGQSCLLARRLVESGVRFINVTMGGWDTHANNHGNLAGRFRQNSKNKLCCRPRPLGRIHSILHGRWWYESWLCYWQKRCQRRATRYPTHSN